MLLSVALLFARSLARVNSINPRFDLQHTTWAKVNLLSDRYPKDQAFLFASQDLEAAAAVPGVKSAAGNCRAVYNFMRIGTPIHTKEGVFNAEYYGNSVSPGYFETMRIQLLAGRQSRS